MLPSALGEYVSEVWLAQPSYQPALVIDTWVVMPNHFHAVIGLANSNNSTNPLTLGKIVQGFKAFSTLGSKKRGLLQGNQLWQDGYYDHIIRSDESLERIREYIYTNPQCWELDRENVRKKGSDEFEDWLAREGKRRSK